MPKACRFDKHVGCRPRRKEGRRGCLHPISGESFQPVLAEPLERPTSVRAKCADKARPRQELDLCSRRVEPMAWRPSFSSTLHDQRSFNPRRVLFTVGFGRPAECGQTHCPVKEERIEDRRECPGRCGRLVLCLPTANPTCGSVSFPCPSGFTPKPTSTVCAEPICVRFECCTGTSLAVFFFFFFSFLCMDCGALSSVLAVLFFLSFFFLFSDMWRLAALRSPAVAITDQKGREHLLKSYWMHPHTVSATCGSVSFTCPSGYTAKSPSTACTTPTCGTADCCTGSSVCSLSLFYRF